MVRTGGYALGLGLLALTTSALPATESDAFVRGDLAGAVCGVPNGAKVASDTRSMDTWNKFDMVDWFANALKPYIVMDWKYPNLNKAQDNIQSIILTLMGSDGSEQCDEIIDPNCGGTGLDWNLCTKHPEAHFVFFAMTHWAHFLNKLQSTLTISTTSITSLTHDIVTQFYTAQSDPTKLIVPVSIVSGIAGALSAAFPPAAVVAGAGALANGILTQAALDRANPIMQWGEVQDAVGHAFTQLTGGLEKYFKNTLKSLPKQQDSANPRYDTDPNGLPQILSHGAFAETPDVGSFNPGIYGGIAASAINALWAADMVFIMILSDEAWGKGAGQACKALEGMTTCIDGVAHILMRWKTSMTKAAVTPNSGANPQEIDPGQWSVRGAYKNGDKNDNHLADYKLNIVDIIQSAEKTFAENGYPFTNQNGATIDHLTTKPLELAQKDLLFFSLPVCDLGAIMGKGKHLNHDVGGDNKSPIEVYGACTCIQGKNWPIKAYSLDSGLIPETCRKNWVSG